MNVARLRRVHSVDRAADQRVPLTSDAVFHWMENNEKLLIAVVLAVCTAPAFAQVGISVNVGEPGFFGQIDLGDAPPPEVVYSQPVIVQRDPGYNGGPVYLHVPPGRERNWRQYCGQYNACGRPVYFVRDNWYNSVYVPHYREHRDHYDHGRGYDNRGHDDHGHDYGRDDHGHDDHGHDHDNH